GAARAGSRRWTRACASGMRAAGMTRSSPLCGSGCPASAPGYRPTKRTRVPPARRFSETACAGRFSRARPFAALQSERVQQRVVVHDQTAEEDHPEPRDERRARDDLRRTRRVPFRADGVRLAGDAREVKDEEID